MDTPKVLATIGKEPAVKALPKRTAMVTDAHGRNTPAWLPEVVGRAEGPLAICVAITGNPGARAYLTEDEALAAMESLMAAVEEYRATPKA